MEIKDFVGVYINQLKGLLDEIDPSVIVKIVESFESTLKIGSRIYVLGNGGSSATASHIANDFGPGLRRRGIANFDVVSLGDNAPVVSAIANDIGYENIFYMQLEGLLQPQDIILAISCSGDSPNIIKAVDYAKKIGSTVIGATGFRGGQLKQVADIVFHVNAKDGEYGLVEDVHMILDHIIYSYYVQRGNNA
jgi:D-sedoheptulose 7-phosphate isomerase